MWPEPVERIASALRAADAVATIEELPRGEDAPPGFTVRVEVFDCDGRPLVALVPADRVLERERLRAAAGCIRLVPAPRRDFPFSGARVLIERTVLPEETLWLHVGSPRHVLGVSPSELVRLTRAASADLLDDT